jgi:hypothetical protein
MGKLMEKVSEAIDAEDFYSDYFDGKLDGKTNLPCPFPDRHKKGEDKLPSFRVFLKDGGTFCHGCGFKSASPVGFLAELKGVSLDKAAKILYRKYVEKTVPQDVYRSAAEKLMDNAFVLKKLLEARGITKETAKEFQLGYDGKRLTIPIFNEDGFCVNVRKYDLFKSGGPKMVSFAEGFGKARLFPLSSLSTSTVYVVEGELDAILGCQMGLNCVSPSGGATAWQDGWGKLFKGKTVFVIPDNDEPGAKGAKLRINSIKQFAESARLLKLPVDKEGEDLTDWVLSYGGTAKKLVELTGEKEEAESIKKPKTKTSFDLFDGLEDDKKSKSEQQMLLRAEAVWNALVQKGAFFKNASGQLFYAGEGIEAMPVSAGVGAFMSFLFNMTPLVNQALSGGRFILNHVIAKAYQDSEFSKTGSWTMCEGGKLYVHAGSDLILQLGKDKPVHIKNAVNDDRVLLDLPIKSMAVKELPTTKPYEGLNLLKTLFMGNLAMRDEDKYLLICWLLSIFYRDYVRPKPIVRFLAKTASGKSTSSKLVSMLLYGEELLSHAASTVAATYEMSNRYPLLILDNLETRNMTAQLEDFLLTAATGGLKAKRTMNTDAGIVIQNVTSLVLTNGIEPFNKHELIDRTLEINLDLERYANPKYQETKVFAGLRDNRQKIMSAILYLMHKYVLPRIGHGELTRIMQEFGSHGKERFNEYFAVMCLTLDALWGFMPLDAYKRPHELVKFWLDSQTRAEHAQDEGTNEVLYFISTFADRSEQLMGAQIKVERGNVSTSFKCTTRDLLSDFRVLSKHLGIRCPWQNDRQLGARLVDSMSILNRAGWSRRTYEAMGRRKYEYVFKGKRTKRERGERSGDI